MSTITADNPDLDATLAELDVQGERIYDTILKASLEPDQNGKVIAIHPETESYAIGRTSTDARLMLRATQPQGLIWTRMIGPETLHSLIRRFSAHASRLRLPTRNDFRMVC